MTSQQCLHRGIFVLDVTWEVPFAKARLTGLSRLPQIVPDYHGRPPKKTMRILHSRLIAVGKEKEGRGR
jgi:hypothetical protein